MFRNLSKNNEKSPLGFLKVVAYDAYINKEKISVLKLSCLQLKPSAAGSIK
jgi:hypothetical protein